MAHSLPNNDFHNTGVPAANGLPEDDGRATGTRQVLTDEFNCLSPYSDAKEGDCAELTYMVIDGHDLERQFKTSIPSKCGCARTLYACRSI